MDFMLILRLFGLFIVSLYIYVKILDIQNLSKSKIVAAIVFSLFMSIPMTILPPVHLVGMLVFVAITARVKTSLMISSVIISVGISLGLDSLAILIILLLEIISATAAGVRWFDSTYQHIFDSTYQHIIDAIILSIASIMFIVFVHYLFKTKRLEKGILFWENKEAVRIGLIFSIFIMINMAILGTAIADDIRSEFLLAFILIANCICTFGLYFWWRYHTTALYQQRIKERDLEYYIGEAQRLSESNDVLSEMVHRDNKLLPAMYNAVSQFLDNQGSNIDAKTKNKGLNILNELDEIVGERKNMIFEIQRTYKTLTSTGIERIDNILNYMLSKTTENEIQFDFTLTEDIKEIAESVIPPGKLGTLLADLIENAMIAVSHSTYKKILVTMGIADDCLEISVQDSGIPFEAETLANLGLRKTTTYADTSGSGIGYLTIFEILNESGASLTITEYATENYAFTKSIKVRFDGKSEYVAYASEADEYRLVTKRKIEKEPVS